MGTGVRAAVTTRFNSFDASPFGGFMESRLGARNSVQAPRGIASMIWIDESVGTYVDAAGNLNEALWGRGLDSCRDRLRDHAALVPPVAVAKMMIMHVLSKDGDHDDIGPIVPAFVLKAEVGRPPSVASNIAAFKAAVLTDALIPFGSTDRVSVVTTINLGIDNPSLTIDSRLDIEPGFSQFLDWLDTNRGAEIGEGVLLHEDVEIVVREHRGEEWWDWFLPAS